jgi:acid phosphatase family membrane protein YuiD
MWQILITSLAAGLIAQLSKPFIKSNGIKLDWSGLLSYSGMPSSHAAFVASLTASVGLSQGFNSALFAVCLIFSVLIIRDALGLRRYLGQQGEIINALTKDLKPTEKPNQTYQQVLEKIGHTPVQIVTGAILGILISLVSFFIF